MEFPSIGAVLGGGASNMAGRHVCETTQSDQASELIRREPQLSKIACIVIQIMIDGAAVI